MMSSPKVEMSIFETLLARRSVRQYKARKVDQTIIYILLEAAVRAPTAVHQEPWRFVVIQDKKLLQHLSDIAKPLFAQETQQRAPNAGLQLNTFSPVDFNIFYNAGTLILICGTSSSPFLEADCWLAAENLMLVACAMGLGTCVIGSALSTLNLDKIKKLLKIPNDISVVAPIIVGYPDDEIAPILRKKPIILANITSNFGT
jgi:nitroreductase